MTNPAYRNIAIEGNIGAGKTTLAKALAEQLDARLVLEMFENNPFLPQFYQDPERYALQLELFFLADRYHQQSKLILGDIFQAHTISDYIFSKSKIFGSINLKEHEQTLFSSLYDIMSRFMPEPDIIIYLHQPLENIEKQIKKRGRAYENEIPSQYLKQIEQGYFQYFKEAAKVPVVLLDCKPEEHPSVNTLVSKCLGILESKWAPTLHIINM